MNRAIKILFVCSQNKWRSRTAEDMYLGFPGYDVRSAGTEVGARVRVTAGHLGWADMIFVMEKKHAAYLHRKFPEVLEKKPLVCLHIPDDFRIGDADLIAILKSSLSPHITVPK
jgi:predicted protein tyrosine phosphatase